MLEVNANITKTAPISDKEGAILNAWKNGITEGGGTLSIGPLNAGDRVTASVGVYLILGIEVGIDFNELGDLLWGF